MEKPASIIPDEHLAAIGMIATWWARLEFEIDRTSWDLAGFTHVLAACMTAQVPSVHNKLKALGAIAEQRGIDPGLVREISKFKAAINGLAEARNRAVHDPRFRKQGDQPVYRLQITAPNSLTFEMVEEPLTSLWKTAAAIRDRIQEFEGIQQALDSAAKDLPDVSGPHVVRAEMTFPDPD